MKTGSEMTSRNLPESFYVILLGLDAILKRYSFKDATHFKTHNPTEIISSKVFTSAVCFNLYSEYGVGKKLEPIIFDLFRDLELDPDKYEDNIFFKEVVQLAHIILPLIRKADSKDETLWTYTYAIESLNKVDDLSRERIDRLLNLFLDKREDIEKDEVEDEIENDGYCDCRFCTEFKKFHYPRDEYAERIILNALMNIDSRTKS
jgi:hypothetical protein